MFAFVALGDEYFASGAIAGLVSALVAAVVCVALGERNVMVYAPRVTTTFFLGSLIKFTPHPVMAGFQNMTAALLFLVQLGNVLGFE
jgi:sulfate permease, SulP family